MTSSTAQTQPESDLDLFSREHVADPFPALAELRDRSAAIYMSKHDFWLLTRYDDIRAATADWKIFSSAQGVALLPDSNAKLVGSVLGSDPPEHDELRAVLSDKLAPRALRTLRSDIAAKADRLVSEVVSGGRFDAVTDLARVFPIDVVADLVGLPKEGREHLHPGADAMFTTFGPYTPMMAERLPAISAYTQLMLEMTDREHLAPGSWGAAAMDAVDDGRLTLQGAINTMSAYMTAGMDTTVNGISSMLRIFGERPDVWEALRMDPSRAGAVLEETVRLETPVQGFFRVTTCEFSVDGTVIPAGARVFLHWGSANRDPRHYENPDVFDIDRHPLDHMAFGYGTHACAGQGLARMEIVTLIEALLAHVQRFELTGEPVRRYNPVVRGLDSVPLMVDLVEG